MRELISIAPRYTWLIEKAFFFSKCYTAGRPMGVWRFSMAQIVIQIPPEAEATFRVWNGRSSV